MQNKTTSYLQLATAIGTSIFWIVFFTIGFENAAYPSCYKVFEYCFPLPDSFMIAMLFLAFLNRRNERWKKFTLVAGGAMIFLGLCDFSFNSMNRMYTISAADGFLNVFINAWSVGFGFFQVRAAWKIST